MALRGFQACGGDPQLQSPGGVVTSAAGSTELYARAVENCDLPLGRWGINSTLDNKLAQSWGGSSG
jgi:hypothetical protein